MVYPLYLVRLADDKEEIKVMAERWQVRTFRVVEVPLEYRNTEIPTEPIFLYEFTATLRDGDIKWRYTSDPSDRIVSKKKWTCADLNHGSLTRSMKLGGTASIMADYDTVEPMRLSIPMLLPGPLRLEIFKTDQSLSTPESIFKGDIRKPSIAGRRISASCAEWGDVMEQRFPNFYIQPVCNHRVYDVGTCNANKASKTVSIQIVSANGRAATVTGTGLKGKKENWFYEGWIEIGVGLLGQTVFVTQNLAAQGEIMQIVTSVPITAELPIAAKIVAGCDGYYGTCDSNFGNLDNFGGLMTPQDNLTLNAIVTTPGGGKK